MPAKSRAVCILKKLNGNLIRQKKKMQQRKKKTWKRQDGKLNLRSFLLYGKTLVLIVIWTDDVLCEMIEDLNWITISTKHREHIQTYETNFNGRLDRVTQAGDRQPEPMWHCVMWGPPFYWTKQIRRSTLFKLELI